MYIEFKIGNTVYRNIPYPDEEIKNPKMLRRLTEREKLNRKLDSCSNTAEYMRLLKKLKELE